jgi:hypothetical protein
MTLCSLEYIPAELFAVSTTAPCSSRTSNIDAPGQGSCWQETDCCDFCISVVTVYTMHWVRY